MQSFNYNKISNNYWCTCGKSASQPFCDGTHTNL
ncbi:CDGSH iron-sulfur domain-containing protein [Clostridium estertheticum]|nr:CDGSH iron-sulfur domain-containing protein [Clostridium estertheticum]WLC72534.1 CDGSH iron-sulfur domain-containing protein [Clostridium estertheticum]